MSTPSTTSTRDYHRIVFVRAELRPKRNVTFRRAPECYVEEEVFRFDARDNRDGPHFPEAP
jgi:hypothetical protein